MLSQKQIAAAVAAGAPSFDNGAVVLVEDVLYKVQKGAVKYRRLPGQKENRRRLGITLDKPSAPVANVAPPITGVKVVTGPAAVRYGKRAAAADFIRYAQRMGILPADRKPVLS